jgi:hypothetical protein
VSERQQLIELLLLDLAYTVEAARDEYGDDYAGRLYHCGSCSSLHGCCAPIEDLHDHYPCPHCGQPQMPLGEAGTPWRNRAQRRTAGRATPARS